MNEPKRHHTVPLLILKNFTNERGMLWCFNKDIRQCFEASPENVFVVKHFYSVVHTDGSRDAFAEKKMGKGIEAEVTPAISKVIDGTRAGRVLDISSEERYALTRFLRIQNARTKAAADIMSFDELFELTILAAEKQGYNVTEEEREQLKDRAIRDQIMKNSWVKHLSDDHFDDEESMDILMRKSIGVMFINKPYESFVIGDYPVIRGANQDGSGRLEDIGVKEILPVAHDVIMYWGRESDCPERVVVSDSNTIRTINEIILRQSTTIAGRFEDTVKSLSGSKAARVTPVVYDKKNKAVMHEVKNKLRLFP